MVHDLTTTKQQTLEDLGNKKLFTAVEVLVETITLNYLINPEGFKIFRDLDTNKSLYGFYWFQNIQGQYWYKETALTPDELQQVLDWRDNK